MEKIDFKNLPDKTTPINAANLNKMQDNTEKAIGEKLDKTSKATSTEAIAGTNNTKYTTPCSVKSAIDKALEGYTPSGGAIEGEIIQETGTASETNVYSSVAMDNKLKTNIVTGQEVATNEYVDGKQIFRKRVDVGNLPGASAKKLVSIGLTNVNIINFSGYYFSSYEGFGIPINHATGTNYYVQTYLVLNTMKIDISCGSDRSSYTGYVDIYYTKNR